MTKLILSEAVINWYEKNGRNLPWRPQKGNKVDPYHILLSEFMLQQTVVKTVIPYFKKFTRKYPTIFKLAETKLDYILSDWSGLGYYRRARNLHQTANIITNDFNGKIPQEYKTLLKFPGIGDYTASAILSIAFDKPSNVIDGNIERIICRLNKITKRLDHAKKEIILIASSYVPNKNNSLYTQGLMDIGATICRPRNTHCFKCPLIKFCGVANKEISKKIPIKKIKSTKSQKVGTFMCYIKDKEKILLIKNNDEGLFANMDVLPSFGWENRKFSKENILTNLETKQVYLKKNVFHSFTHFDLKARIIVHEISKIKLSINFELVKFKNLEKKAIPVLYKKIINTVIQELKISA